MTPEERDVLFESLFGPSDPEERERRFYESLFAKAPEPVLPTPGPQAPLIPMGATPEDVVIPPPTPTVPQQVPLPSELPASVLDSLDPRLSQAQLFGGVIPVGTVGDVLKAQGNPLSESNRTVPNVTMDDITRATPEDVIGGPELMAPVSPEAKEATRSVRRFAGEAAAMFPAGMWTLLQGATTPLAMATEEGPEAPPVDKWLRELPLRLGATGEATRKNILGMFGVTGEAGDLPEKIAELGGRSLTPAGAYTLPMSVAGLAGNVASDALRYLSKQQTPAYELFPPDELPVAQAQPWVDPRRVTPVQAQAQWLDFLVSPAEAAPSKGKDVQWPSPMEQELMKSSPAAKGAVDPGPGADMDKAPSTVKPSRARKAKPTLVFRDLLAESPALQNVIDTIGGKTTVTNKDLMVAGGVAMGTVGMAFLPGTFRVLASSLNNTSLGGARLRPITDVIPGGQQAYAFTNPLDYMRATFDDINAAITRSAERAGMPLPAVHELQSGLRMQTRTGATQLARNFVESGDINVQLTGMPRPVSLQMRTSMGNLASDTRGTRFNEYVHLLDTENRIQAESIRQLDPRTAAAAIARRGAGRELVFHELDLPTATRERQTLEAADPRYRPAVEELRRNNEAHRRILSSGEYATMTREERNQLNAQRPYEVVSRGRDIETPRLNPIEDRANVMVEQLRGRMENEQIGRYIDSMRRIDERYWRPVTAAELEDNPAWRDYSVSFKRKGEREYYLGDPTIAHLLQMDPYYLQGVGNLAYGFKRSLEIGATGVLAPWFAPVSMTRSYLISKMTTPGPVYPTARLGPFTYRNVFAAPVTPGMRAPTAIGSVMGIPQQVLPQWARGISISLQRGSGGWLGNVFGRANVDAMAVRLAQHHMNSLWHQLEVVGGSEGAYLQQHNAATKADLVLRRAMNRLAQVGREDPILRPFQTFLGATIRGLYMQPLKAFHSAVGYNFARRNIGRGMPTRDVAWEALNITGSPRVGGQYLFGKDVGYGERVLRRHIGPSERPYPGERLTQTLGFGAARGLGGLSEFLRTTSPWANVTLQGIKRVVQSYWENPFRFTARLWMSVGLPTATAYYLMRSLDYSDRFNPVIVDPTTGQPVIDKFTGEPKRKWNYTRYAMEGRSAYNTQMNLYIPIPGRPPEDGIEVPQFHEVTVFKRLMEVGLDHMFRSSKFPLSEEFGRAFGAYGKLFIPATPPPVAAAFGVAGMALPMGNITEVYRPQREAFGQMNGLPAGVELSARALFGGVADVGVAAYTAFTQGMEPRQSLGWLGSVQAGLSEAGQRMASKTPYVRDFADIRAPMSGQTEMSSMMWDKLNAAREITKYFGKFGLTGERQFSAQRPGIRGTEIVRELFEMPPDIMPGISKPEPTNPLFIDFAEKLKTDINSDKTTGFRTMMMQYSKLTDMLRDLRDVNEGNNVTWQRELRDKPELVEHLEKNSVDPTNLRQVRNFYEKKRQDVARTLLFTITGIEKEISREVGRPIKIEDLKPYAKPTSDVGTPTQNVEQWFYEGRPRASVLNPAPEGPPEAGAFGAIPAPQLFNLTP